MAFEGKHLQYSEQCPRPLSATGPLPCSPLLIPSLPLSALLLVFLFLFRYLILSFVIFFCSLSLSFSFPSYFFLSSSASPSFTSFSFILFFCYSSPPSYSCSLSHTFSSLPSPDQRNLCSGLTVSWQCTLCVPPCSSQECVVSMATAGSFLLVSTCS